MSDSARGTRQRPDRGEFRTNWTSCRTAAEKLSELKILGFWGGGGRMGEGEGGREEILINLKVFGDI